MKTDHGKVIILADRREGHLPYVLPHLAKEPLIIDTARILSGEHLTYQTSPSGDIEVIYMGRLVHGAQGVWLRSFSSECILEAKTVAEQVRKTLGKTTAATAALHKLIHDLLGNPEDQYWANGVPVASIMQQYAASSLNRLAGAIAHMFPEAFWVSERDAIAKAMHKPLQLKLAQQVGLGVPETIFTSDPKAALAFLVEHGVCVVKPLALNAPPGLNQYTTKLYASDPPDFEGLWANPQIFQECVEPAYEVRVTVIGEHVFAAEVADEHPDAKTDAGTIRDWRQAFERGTFRGTAITLPRDVAEACIKIVHCYPGLKTGMFDFIVDHRGRYIFLEINPNGAWGFIEEATGQPIGKTLAHLLQGNS
jgi:glutathione synthase/RimK-type ligase-like ATP-grasp enzyme